MEKEQLLLDDRFAPITSSIGFIEADFNQAVTAFENWQREIKEPLGIKTERLIIDKDLEQSIKKLLPLCIGGMTRYLFLPTHSDWVGFIDNGHRGTDPSAIRYMATRLNCRTLWVVTIPHTYSKVGKQWKGRQGALIFELYGPEYTDLLNTLRSIRLQNIYGKWEWVNEGTPLSFEDLDRYNAKQLLKRLDLELITEYLNCLGLKPFDEDFYLPPKGHLATLIESSGNLPGALKDISLNAARKLCGYILED